MTITAPAPITARRAPIARPSPRALVVLAGVLVSYNVALNLAPFPPAVYVPVNLALAATAVALGRRAGLSLTEMGLRSQRRGVLLGLGMLLVIGGGILVASTFPLVQPLLADQRAAGVQGWAGVLYGAGLRIPLGTAVPEEIIFRGVLLGALLRVTRPVAAALWSSVVFGLWHIGPSIVLVQVNGLDSSPALAFGLVATSVVLTTIAGLGFCLLRRWGGGVVAPVLTHVATNSASLIAVVIARSV